MKENLWLVVATCLAYCVDQELWKAIDYLKEQVSVLKEQQEKDLGVHAQPNGPWMEQIARNVSGEGGFLAGKKYLIHDRDSLYTERFDSILKAAGVDPVKLPPRSPNLNAHAERFVRSVKEECLDLLILSSEEQLRYVLAEYQGQSEHRSMRIPPNMSPLPFHFGQGFHF